MIFHHIIHTIFFVCGLLAFGGAAADASWLLDSQGARQLVRSLGHRGTRLFYAVVGLVLMGMACFFHSRIG